jgi:hypothetical protein
VERKDHREATHWALERVEATRVAVARALPRLEEGMRCTWFSIENLVARTLRKRKLTS